MKNFAFVIVAIVVSVIGSCSSKHKIPNERIEFDGSSTWVAPYTLSFPRGWGVERFSIPIEFAPKIPYRGVEDIRFAPGFGLAEHEEYWTYAFLWYLDETPEIDEKVIEDNLNEYYNGLIGRNIGKRKIPADKLFPVRTSVKEITTAPGDLKTFNGTIAMLDYLAQRPQVLNCVVHLKSCAGQTRGFIFHEISPKPTTDKVWQSLESLWRSFDCNVQEEKK